MSEGVNLSVRSSLSTIIKEMENVRLEASKLTEELKKSGDELDKNITENTKNTETHFARLRSLGRRVADQLRGDFKTLVGLNSVAGALKLSNQFAGSIDETIALANSIRKLGTTFGITGANFGSFQSKLVKGLGEIGLASDVAARSMDGLKDTPVRGEDNILGYSQQAGMLGSISGQQGQEGAIAKGIARVIQARGGNVNDQSQVQALSENLRKIFNQTGTGPTESLRFMEQLFAQMPKDLRKAISSSGLTNLAAAGAVGGPNATKFLEEYLGKSPIARKAFEAQGGAGIFTDQGIDTEKFGAFAKSITSRVGGDPRLAAQTLGLSEEAAEGFVRLAENLDQVRDAQDKMARSTGNLKEQYRSSMGFGEAFRANINRVKGAFSAPLSLLQQGTNLLSKASETDAGAAAVVGGGGLLAALLAGGGIKALGKGLGGVGTGAAIEGLTGREVQPVYVVNASEIGGGGMLEAAAGKGGVLGKLGTLAKGAGAVTAAGAAGYGVGSLIEPSVTGALDKYTTGTTAEGFEGNALERLFAKIDVLVDKMGGANRPTQPQRVKVELNKRDLKETKPQSKGGSF